jgi:glycerol-3-phosphate dehydrogenase (NAD(P)+)
LDFVWFLVFGFWISDMTVTSRVCVVGLGGWGIALSILLRKKGFDVSLWGHPTSGVDDIAKSRTSDRFLPGVKIPAEIAVSGSPDALRGAGLVVLAVPTQHIRGVLSSLKPGWPSGAPVVSVAKGIEVGTGLPPTGIVRAALGDVPLGVLSGPSHAEEVVRGLPASVVAASADAALAKRVQDAFMGERFRVYTSADVAGVELGGALKNVIAIAAGICDGLKLGDNAKAALLTRGLVEMTRYAAAHGADPRTLYGLAGLGDILTTAYSPHGRNLAVGRRIGAGERLDDILEGMAQVAEGVWTAKAVRAAAQAKGLAMPIAEAVHAILYGGKPPAAAVKDLMTRSAKDE